MSQRILAWSRQAARWSGLGGIALVPGVSQEAAAPGVDLGPLLIVAVALLGPIVLGLGIAFISWLISRGTPPAVVGPQPPKPAKPREVLPAGVHLPPPSSRPLVLALGTTVISFGIVLRGLAIQITDEISIPIILVLGLLIFAWGLFGWIRDDYQAADKH